MDSEPSPPAEVTDRKQLRQQILKEQRNQPAYKRLKRKLRIVLGSLGLFTVFELLTFTALDVSQNLMVILWFLTAVFPWTLGLGVWIRPEQKELREWRQIRVFGSIQPVAPPQSTGVPEAPGSKRRPLGITLISLAWIIAGIGNLYYGLKAVSGDIHVLSLLSGSVSTQIVVDNWFKFGLSADAANSAFLACVGFGQLAVVSGLLVGKRWSYNATVAVVILLVINWMIGAAILYSAPSYLHISTSSVAPYVIGSLFWLAIYWGYLRRPQVKEYFGFAPDSTLAHQEVPSS